MKRILYLGAVILFSSGVHAQTVAPAGQTPLARMQEDEVSGSAREAIENAKKNTDGKNKGKNANSAQQHHDDEKKDKVKRNARDKDRHTPPP